MSEKLLPKPVTLKCVLGDPAGDNPRDFLRDSTWRSVLCIELFAKLMDVKRFPKRIRVTVSTRLITGAARVYVKLVNEPRWGVDDLAGYWQDPEGEENDLTSAAEDVLGALGAIEAWRPIWIDFKRVRSDTAVSSLYELIGEPPAP